MSCISWWNYPPFPHHENQISPGAEEFFTSQPRCARFVVGDRLCSWIILSVHVACYILHSSKSSKTCKAVDIVICCTYVPLSAGWISLIAGSVHVPLRGIWPGPFHHVREGWKSVVLSSLRFAKKFADTYFILF